ncbi:phosphoribosylformylglycinamidine synthase subunit PurL [Candidatus Liberibacter asiaticus]|uniref:Phosphoribosylformylglycinamidine synthase subunit PurL n=5 Tax=Liberibacter asiaticus TaxID=34021 RepID=C6XGE0_LIBAP|nr:phosphoribosylformylglycinamidine synthase subunit PurL [Candidatus Liberibacter asiaticus]ACT57443.1 phosphoribosylformylglycinamidine synthase II [Candidatus Liberibacter asiaticus str. psy62]AGH17206.1 phosphoribosylformylglycinamidine synthase II [Candidatus Liberibacter asiaticus str. gxpsy]ALK07505.1 phosphoribosylformylglycinamidine synthase subunit PurL [Candidatus Liberibacter asiaticus]ASK52995.1 phosphoribosylformylglycinamidine synthase II [Candidatus Liberibacter asiaticus]AWL1
MSKPSPILEILTAHGLTKDECDQIIHILKRQPTLTEIGIISAMWNEHCSYKSSKKWLRTLPTTGKHVIQGPGENAGVVDIGGGDCVVFKMESHNHPSYIEPYQGAATGVGGILRDIFTMGARPVAAMNSLRFGAIHHPKTKHLLSGVVAGIAGYSNSFGVPTVGGEVEFLPCYNNNIIVNTFAAGIAKTNAIFSSKARGIGLPLVYLGAKTGRDGIGGASMASEEFGENIAKKRPTVQVGDPFTGKCLLEACLELMNTDAVIAIQDMGAAGLTCSAIEMGNQGNLGITLDLDKVPTCEEGMTAYEMMLSESQERMLMILNPEKQHKAQEILNKWGLHFSIIGITTNDKLFRVIHRGEEVANLPIKALSDEAPEYDRAWCEPITIPPSNPQLLCSDEDCTKSLLKLLSSPNLSSRRWVYEQYDTMIQSNSIQLPGGDAGVIRVEGHETKALAFSSDVTPRYVKADPFEGTKQAVAECWRNIIATGAKPLAITDNLNFGNPEKEEIMGQFVHSVKGIREACQILDFPIVSGNVSFYNETNGQSIFPTPTIAGVGILPDYSLMTRIDSAHEGDLILMIGNDGCHLDCSMYSLECASSNIGPPPKVDCHLEKNHGFFVLSMINAKKITACHDISTGGLIITLAEMTISSAKGMDIILPIEIEKDPKPFLFGEDQGRYVVCISPENQDLVMSEANNKNIPLRYLGKVSGSTLSIHNILNIPVATLQTKYESWFPEFISESTV